MRDYNVARYYEWPGVFPKLQFIRILRQSPLLSRRPKRAANEYNLYWTVIRPHTLVSENGVGATELGV